MPGHPLGQAHLEMERLVELIGKKREEGPPAPSDAEAGILRPINQPSAPDHHGEHGNIDPVEPADRQRMLLLQSFHPRLLRAARVGWTELPALTRSGRPAARAGARGKCY